MLAFKLNSFAVDANVVFRIHDAAPADGNRIKGRTPMKKRVLRQSSVDSFYRASPAISAPCEREGVPAVSREDRN